MSGIIAQRYARALMNLAVQAGQVEPVAEGLDDMADMLDEAPLLTAFVEDTKVPPAKKQTMHGKGTIRATMFHVPVEF